MSQGRGLLLAKPLKSSTRRGRHINRWRVYETEDRALMAWRGTNTVARVVRSLYGTICNFDSLEDAVEWARKQGQEVSEWPKCERCGRYYGLAEGAHVFRCPGVD